MLRQWIKQAIHTDNKFFFTLAFVPE